MDRELCRKHYEEHLGKDFYTGLEEFMISGPLIAVVVDGDVAGCRLTAKTIREQWNKDYAGGPRNLIHASDSEASAVREVGLWFPEL